MSGGRVRNVLTFDVEDWYQGLDIAPARWAAFERRLSVGLEFVLNTLDEFGVRATFFVLGIAAREHPVWVRRIADAGHEIATHGWSHTPIYRQSREAFRRELCCSLDTLQQLTGQRVHGHRAAFFSITAQSQWALAELAQAGLCYDSSIFPVRNYRYGIPAAERFPHRVRIPTPTLHRFTGEGTVWELPISTARIAGVNVPFGGGFYLRFWHYAFVRLAIRQLNVAGKAAVIYFHPWEFDAQQPRLARESHWLARATHYHRLDGTRATLRRLLSDFCWTTARGYLEKTREVCETSRV